MGHLFTNQAAGSVGEFSEMSSLTLVAPSTTHTVLRLSPLDSLNPGPPAPPKQGRCPPNTSLILLHPKTQLRASA